MEVGGGAGAGKPVCGAAAVRPAVRSQRARDLVDPAGHDRDFDGQGGRIAPDGPGQNGTHLGVWRARRGGDPWPGFAAHPKVWDCGRGRRLVGVLHNQWRLAADHPAEGIACKVVGHVRAVARGIVAL